MCTEDMMIENNEEKVKILPTHFKDKTTSKKQPMHKNQSWRTNIKIQEILEEQDG